MRAAAAIVCMWAAAAHGQEVVAVRVNGVGITVAEIEARFDENLKDKGLHLLQVRDPARVKQMKHEALDSMIDEELLWQEARRNDAVAKDGAVDAAFAQAARAAGGEDRLRLRLAQIEVSEVDFRERIRRRLTGTDFAARSAAAGAAVSDSEILSFYEANRARFHRPEMLRVRHVLIRVSPDASRSERAAARRHMIGILSAAKAGSDFGELARVHSQDATKQWDGELDPFARGSFPPAFERAAFALKPGEISEIVTTPDGFQILKLEERIPEIAVSEQNARERIRAYLDRQRAAQARETLLAQLRAQAKIEVRLPY